MQVKWRVGIAMVAGSLLLATAPVFTEAAFANTDTSRKHATQSSSRSTARVVAHADSKHPLKKNGKARYAGGGGIQCVTFARATSGIALKGNAANWWDAAAGVYERGSRPETGSVLNFRANGHMRLGHVAVVTNVRGEREIEIDHANWNAFGYAKGNVSRGIKVIDVSDNNDWSRVRVELGHTEQFGSIYPAYGFIYDRPDSGRMVANNGQNLIQPVAQRAVMRLDEVAEAPAPRTVPAALPVDAPSHSLR